MSISREEFAKFLNSYHGEYLAESGCGFRATNQDRYDQAETVAATTDDILDMARKVAYTDEQVEAARAVLCERHGVRVTADIVREMLDAASGA